MFSGFMALTLFIIGGAITFAYKKPDGYNFILGKLFNVLGLVIVMLLSMYMGMDSVIFKLGLSPNELGIHKHLLHESRYLWCIPLAATIIYFIFNLIGSLAKGVKNIE
jgi:hypothetical protein